MANRQIRIIPSFTGYREGVICFETQCAPEEVRDLSKYAFEHHGDAFSPFDAGALRLFHERVLLGQDMPSTLILTNWYRFDQVMAAAIFVNPLIILEASCTNVVNSFDLIDRLGPPAYGHIPHDHKELALLIRNITEPYSKGQARSEKILEILSHCVGLIHRYVEEGTLPPIDIPLPEYTILHAEGPFVAYESNEYVWDEMWRKGYLWGLWKQPEGPCEVRRKSQLVTCIDWERVENVLGWEKSSETIFEGGPVEDVAPLIANLTRGSGTGK